MNHYDRIYNQIIRDAGHLGGLPLWLALRALPAVVAAVLVLLLLWAVPGRAMVPGEGSEPTLDGLASGHMLLQGERPGHYTPAILQASKVHFDISGMIATVVVEQSFSNDTGRALEGVHAASAAVPNTRPRGQAPQTFAYLRTATTGPAKVWLGMLLLFAATMVRVMRQPELDHVPAVRE